MQTKHLKIAVALIDKLEHDNGCKFEYQAQVVQDLTEGIKRMMSIGVEFTPEVIFTMAAGSDEERGHGLYTKPGAKEIFNALEIVFNSLIAPPGPQKRVV